MRAECARDAQPQERRERARHGQVRAEVQTDEQRTAVLRRVRRQENRGRQVVDRDRRHRARCGGAHAAKVVEEPCGAGPPAAKGSEEHRDDEETDQHAQVEHDRDPCPADALEGAGRDADPQDGNCRCREEEDRDRRGSDGDEPDPDAQRCLLVGVFGCVTQLARNTTSSRSAVEITAAIAAPNVRERNVAPETCSPWRAIRFVRFEPGRKSDAEFAMNTLPYRNGSSSTPRARARCSSTGVRKNTDVSRFRTAVTPTTSERASR